MPELAEVEYARRLLAESIVGKRITDVKVMEGCDTNIFKKTDASPEGYDPSHNGEFLASILKDSILVDVRRKGKNLVWFARQERQGIHAIKAIHFHFGMKGMFCVEDPNLKMQRIQYATDGKRIRLGDNESPSILSASTIDTTTASASKDTEVSSKDTPSETKTVKKTKAIERKPAMNINQYVEDCLCKSGWPPKHWKMLMETDDQSVKVGFTDSRKFAKVTLLESGNLETPGEEEQLINSIWLNAFPDLAPDPYYQLPSEQEFKHKIDELGKRKLKNILLDQAALVCGVGNWLADDILYDCCLHPLRTAESLDDRDILSFRNSIKKIVDESCAVDADASKFPQHYLFHVRWSARPGKTIDPTRPQLQLLQVEGRTTVVDPKRQKAPAGVEVDPKRKKGEMRPSLKSSMKTTMKPAMKTTTKSPVKSTTKRVMKSSKASKSSSAVKEDAAKGVAKGAKKATVMKGTVVKNTKKATLKKGLAMKSAMKSTGMKKSAMKAATKTSGAMKSAVMKSSVMTKK